MPVVAVQSVIPHLQSTPAVLVVAPSVMIQPVDGRFEQVLVEAMQYMPVSEVQSVDPHKQPAPAQLDVAPLVTAHESRQQSEPTQIVVAQLTADKSCFKVKPVGHDDETKAVLLPSILLHVGVVQHSFPLSAQKVQTVVVVVPVLAEESGQVTAPLAVLFLPQLPHVESEEQVSWYMLVPG